MPTKSSVEIDKEGCHISIPTSPFSSPLIEPVGTRVDPLLGMACGTGRTLAGGSYTLRGNIHYILQTYIMNIHHMGRVTKKSAMHTSGVAS